jgi:release factor glutamine methyltransferase
MTPQERIWALEIIEKRRNNGEPLQYILGEWEFMGLTIKCDPRALIPRMETEFLVEMAAGWLRERRLAAPRILDACTGSGCIAIAMARLVPGAGVTACDISPAALALARENAEQNGQSIRFIQSDLLEQVRGPFDLIISNPPYITTAEMHSLPDSVRNYEPHLALHGGGDGLEAYRRLAPAAYKALSPGGAVFLEIGPTGAAELFRAAGFIKIEISPDLAGIPRYIQGEKPDV